MNSIPILWLSPPLLSRGRPQPRPRRFLGLCLWLVGWGLLPSIALAQFNGTSGIYALNHMTFGVMSSPVNPISGGGGTGYTVGDVLTLDCGDTFVVGTKPTVTVTAAPGGVISTVTLTNPGFSTKIPSTGLASGANGVCNFSSTGGTGTGAVIYATFGFNAALLNSSSAGGGGGGSGNFTLYPTHTALIAGTVAAPASSGYTLYQQGFSNAGDGGAVAYDWNASSYCPGGVSGLPITADGIACILPSSQSASTAGRYLYQSSGTIDVRSIGMSPGGQDNAPYQTALWTAVGLSTGTGPTILFPPVVGQQTYYYFSQPFVVQSEAIFDCRSAQIDFPGASTLIFPAGVSGVINENAYLTPNSRYGFGETSHCSVTGLGTGSANVGVTIGVKQAVVAPAGGGTGYGTGTGTLTWNGPGPCTIPPVLTATASAGAITSVSITTAGACQGFPGDSTSYPTYKYIQGVSTSWTVGGGLSAGTGATIDEIYLISGTNVTWTSVELNTTLYSNGAFGFPASVCGNTAGGRQCYVSAGDGIIAISNYLPPQGSLIVAPGAYIGAANINTRTATLASPYTILNAPALSQLTGQANIMDLPVGQKFTVQTTTGSNTATVTAGPRILRPGDLLWSDAFLFGSSVYSVANAIVGTPTVNTGGSGFVGTSGTLTYGGPECPNNGYNAPPILNVTASGGIITSVTSVANAGDCVNAQPTASSTNWIAGGGLSGGSGASFNMTFNQTITVVTPIMQPGAPANALVTHTSGSPGQMWVIPEGVICRVQCRVKNSFLSGFGIQFDLISNGTPPVGGDSTSVSETTMTDGLIGRFARGSNTTASTYTSNVFAGNYIADEIDAASLGSTNVSEEDNSQDSGSSIYGTLVLCGSQNYSVFVGSYLSGQGRLDTSGVMNGCMGLDAQGNYNIGVPAIGSQTATLWLGGLYGTPFPAITAGSFGGQWSFVGPGGYAVAANAGTPSSGNTVNLNTIPVMHPNLGITDLTNPFAIPSNTTVTGVGYGALTMSNNMNSQTPIQAGDLIDVYDVRGSGAPCIQINGGLVQSDQGIWFGTDCTFTDTDTVAITYSNSFNQYAAWRMGTGGGYMVFEPNGLSFPTGIRSGQSTNNDLTGRITLSAGAATYTLTQTYTTAPNCLTADVTTPANANHVTESTTTLTFAGTGTDVIKYICAGEN